MKKTKNQEIGKSVVSHVKLSTEKDSSWSKSFAILTHALLWVIAVYGLFILPAIVSFGSKHSYYGDKFNRTQWVVFFGILLVYNTVASIYLGLPTNSKKYLLVGLINSVLLLLFFAATFISSFFIFY